MTKTMSIRMDRENFEFLNELTKEQRSDLSKAVRDMVTRGRVLLAVEKYKKGEASLGRAAELAVPCKPKYRPRDKSFSQGRFAAELDIRPGDPLDANIEDGSIVLTPRKKRAHRAKLVTDPVTGLPALSAGPNAPTLSSKEVEEILANFP